MVFFIRFAKSVDFQHTLFSEHSIPDEIGCKVTTIFLNKKEIAFIFNRV